MQFFCKSGLECSFLLQNDPMQFISLLYQVNLTGQQSEVEIALGILGQEVLKKSMYLFCRMKTVGSTMAGL